MRAITATEPSAKLDYASIADYHSLQEFIAIEGPVMASIALHLGNTRLIDNLILTPKSETT